MHSVHPVDEDLLDRIITEELQSAVAGDRQEVNVTVIIASTELVRHPLSLSESGSVPHPACGGMGHPREGWGHLCDFVAATSGGSP